MIDSLVLPRFVHCRTRAQAANMSKNYFCTAGRYRPGAHFQIIAVLLCSAPLSAVCARLSGLSAVVDHFTAGAVPTLLSQSPRGWVPCEAT